MTTEDEEITLYTHKYAIQFDIMPEISYLNQEKTIIIAYLLPHLHGFPSDVWISQETIDEGLDFCRVIFWVISESADAIKSFGIWFQALFRDAELTGTLERLVYFALDEPCDLTVELSDWTRILASDTEINEVVKNKKTLMR